MSEQWLPVPGSPGYEVSDQGRVRGPSGILHQGRMKVGYLRVSLGSRSARKPVHTLVLTAFVGPRPTGMEACHNNGDHTDNRLVNLRWDTRRENQRDRVRHGTHHNSSKTQCPQGHEYSEGNTRVATRADGRTYRACRACARGRR